MIIGVPREIKDNEYRVAMVPSGVKALSDAGHTVLVEKDAGAGSGIADTEFAAAGARIMDEASEVYRRADMIVKVKEPQSREYRYVRDGLLIFTFLHLAAEKHLADILLRSGCTALGYETVETGEGGLPILGPMSEIAGRLSVQVGAHYLMKSYGGEGVLLGGIPGTERGRVVIIGAGNVGANAARIAVGLGAEVTVLNRSVEKLKYLDDIYGGRINTLISNHYNVERATGECDLLIGAVHMAGSRTAKVVTRQMVSRMKKGSVIVDVSVDQGGCVETIVPTTHSQPTYDVDGVIHYGVANMPGAVPRTSTFALTNATLPYIMNIAGLGLKEATVRDPALKRGVNVHRGRVTHPGVAGAIGKEFAELSF